MEEFSIQATVHGRYLLREPWKSSAVRAVIAGFHGYGQSAEDELSMLSSIPGSEIFTICSIEALHPFYTDKGQPGNCWMTSHQRELRTDENIHYVEAVLEKVLPPDSMLILHGFSQGTGMACRAALQGKHHASGVMLLGGDIPPELAVTDRMAKVHIARGHRDPIYGKEQFERDCGRLTGAGAACISCSFKGGHYAGDEYLRSAGEFLETLIIFSS
ncbi:MAG: phospholipase [Chlorobiaceae bacterium]|nr:phospholipase [Chlorobiaceae bacterium]NTW10550.1 phospholipase [Chlorobiaceae bacterium]